jgi:hypothetical protein
MSLPRDSKVFTELDSAPAVSGNLPNTAHTGLIFLEYANLERKSGGVWSAIGTNLPVTFDRVETAGRVRLETWTHKPLFSVWLSGVTSIQDGDRLIRADGSHWYVRGAPMVAPGGTHIVALVEAAAEDGLFAARSASEPS